MGLVGQLLALILAGYVFTVTSNLGRYWFMRKQGYELLFVILFVGWWIHNLMVLCSPGLQWLLEACGVNFSDAEVSENMRDRTITNGGIVVASLLAVLLNLKFDGRTAAKLVARASGDIIECILQRAVEEVRMVELAMENGKCYVGFPLDSGITTSGDSDVSVLPIMSGYRDKDTKDLRITVHYANVLSARKGRSLEDFLVALPKDQVLSARLFDLDVYLTGFDGQIDVTSQPDQPVPVLRPPDATAPS